MHKQIRICVAIFDNPIRLFYRDQFKAFYSYFTQFSQLLSNKFSYTLLTHCFMCLFLSGVFEFNFHYSLCVAMLCLHNRNTSSVVGIYLKLCIIYSKNVSHATKSSQLKEAVIFSPRTNTRDNWNLCAKGDGIQ